MALRWKNSFSCNIKEIDEHHKKLLEISSKLNILEPVCSKIDFADEIFEVIGELKSYTIYHFAYEEKLMQKYHFEGCEEHCTEHQAFIAEIIDLEHNRAKFSSPEMVRKTINFINDWIVTHILKTDMKYKDFLNNKGVH